MRLVTGSIMKRLTIGANMTNPNDPVWGVIIMLVIGLIGTCWAIYAILGDEE